MPKSPSEKAFDEWYKDKRTSLGVFSAKQGWDAGVEWTTSRRVGKEREFAALLVWAYNWLKPWWEQMEEGDIASSDAKRDGLKNLLHDITAALSSHPEPISIDFTPELKQQRDRADEAHRKAQAVRTAPEPVPNDVLIEVAVRIPNWLRKYSKHLCPECNRPGEPIGTVQLGGVTNYRCLGCGHHFAE